MKSKDENFELQFLEKGTNWLFRYDCIVAESHPSLALTLSLNSEF